MRFAIVLAALASLAAAAPSLVERGDPYNGVYLHPIDPNGQIFWHMCMTASTTQDHAEIYLGVCAGDAKDRQVWNMQSGATIVGLSASPGTCLDAGDISWVHLRECTPNNRWQTFDFNPEAQWFRAKTSNVDPSLLSMVPEPSKPLVEGTKVIVTGGSSPAWQFRYA